MVTATPKKVRRNAEYADRLALALLEKGVPRHQQASTIARWCDRDTKNPEFARRWLRGYNNPREHDQVILADKLNVDLEWLKFGCGTKTIDVKNIAFEKNKFGLDAEFLELLYSMSHEQIITLKLFLKTIKK